MTRKESPDSIKNDHSFEFVGKVDSLPVLKSYYERSDFFTMPSKAETFGLVYIEALLQGLPVMYTQNEGIDGFMMILLEKKWRTLLFLQSNEGLNG